MTTETISVEDYAKRQDQSAFRFLDSVSLQEYEELRTALLRKVWWKDRYTDRAGAKATHHAYAYERYKVQGTSDGLTLKANLATLRYLKWLEAEQEGEQV